MIETEEATEGETQDPDLDQAPATTATGETVEETTAGDTLALLQETDAAAAEATPVMAAVAVTTEGEADLLTSRREALLRMTEETTLRPQVTTSESDL
jgi:hypothetical protein